MTTERNLAEVYTELCQAYPQDAELRQALQTDPRKVFLDRGVTLPEGLKIKIHEQQDAKTMHLTLPPEESDVLSDEDLEHVAGGGLFTSIVSLIVGIVVTGAVTAAKTGISQAMKK